MREGGNGEGRKDGSLTCTGAASQTDVASAAGSVWGRPGAPRAAWGHHGSPVVVCFSMVYVSLRVR